MKIKPKSIRVTRTCRTIMCRSDYATMRSRLYNRQAGCCFLEPSKYVHFEFFVAHHMGGRGIGGSRRNDRIWFEFDEAVKAAENNAMLPGYCYGLCEQCHRKHHAQTDQKLHWTKRTTK